MEHKRHNNTDDGTNNDRKLPPSLPAVIAAAAQLQQPGGETRPTIPLPLKTSDSTYGSGGRIEDKTSIHPTFIAASSKTNAAVVKRAPYPPRKPKKKKPKEMVRNGQLIGRFRVTLSQYFWHCSRTFLHQYSLFFVNSLRPLSFQSTTNTTHTASARVECL